MNNQKQKINRTLRFCDHGQPESRCGYGKEKRDNQAMPDNMQVLNCVFEYNDNYYYEEVITSISNITRKNEK